MGAAFEAYCVAVENSAAWGGQLELGALAQALQRHIAVYSVGMPRVDMGAEFKGACACFGLLPLLAAYSYHRFYYYCCCKVCIGVIQERKASMETLPFSLQLLRAFPAMRQSASADEL